ATSGHPGGTVKAPTDQQVSAGGTGHAEAVEVVYAPAKVSYAKLLDAYWHSIDPLVKDKRFCDSGDQYRTAIFYRTDEEKKLAEETKRQVEAKFAPRTVYTRSEERRVGKECRSRWGRYEEKKKRYKQAEKVESEKGCGDQDK